MPRRYVDELLQLALFEPPARRACAACGKVDFSSIGNCRTCAKRRSALKSKWKNRLPAPTRRCGHCWGPIIGAYVSSRYRLCRDCAPDQRDRNLVKTYGIDRHMFDAIYFEQDGKCAIPCCPREAVAVDHCHATGRVRGLLCSRCNCAVGFVEDEAWLRSALEFLA